MGFCHSDDSMFLIYEFLQKGSLGDLIGRSDFELPWSVRLRIAIGVAQGLAYLHKDYVPHLLHRNVKSKNVLLDPDFEPKLTDFALDRIIGENAFRSSLASESASSCYIAPGIWIIHILYRLSSLRFLFLYIISYTSLYHIYLLREISSYNWKQRFNFKYSKFCCPFY